MTPLVCALNFETAREGLKIIRRRFGLFFSDLFLRIFHTILRIKLKVFRGQTKPKKEPAEKVHGFHPFW